MKVEAISLTEAALEDQEWRDAYKIKVDGVTRFRAYDGEPEDNNLGRNFSDVYSVPELMQEAYRAALRGEDFSLENIQVEEM